MEEDILPLERKHEAHMWNYDNILKNESIIYVIE